jgi:hypothetical protein
MLLDDTKTVQLSAPFPSSGSVSTVKTISYSGITNFIFGLSGVSNDDGGANNTTIYKIFADYGDGKTEYFNSSLGFNNSKFLYEYSIPETIEHTYNPFDTDTISIGRIDFMYLNGFTSTVFLSVFAADVNQIDRSVFIDNVTVTNVNGKPAPVINFSDTNSNMFITAISPNT